MTPDQLRELADRLEPMSAAPGFDGLDVPALAAWLRQCAEQRPAAYKHTEPNGHVSYFHTDESPCELCVPLYAAPVPPQRDLSTAERGVLDESLRKSVKVVARGKREPLSDERLREVLIAEARRIARDFGEPNPESLSVIDEGMLAEVMRAGRAVERAHGIGGSDER